MTAERVISLAVTLLCFLVPISAQVNIVFVDTTVEVKEGQQFELRIRRLGPISKIINVIVEVSIYLYMSQSMTKQQNDVHPVKTQISLGGCPD